MIGGDEMRSNSTGRDERAPGRRPTSRMNNVDLAIKREFGERTGIAVNRPRLLGLERQRDVLDSRSF